jgi:hypothetical protein
MGQNDWLNGSSTPSSTFVRRRNPLWKEKARQENCVFLKWCNIWIKKCTIHYVQQTLLTLWAGLLYLTFVKRVSNCAPKMHSLPNLKCVDFRMYFIMSYLDSEWWIDSQHDQSHLICWFMLFQSIIECSF